jgi:hypothetical protein
VRRYLHIKKHLTRNQFSAVARQSEGEEEKESIFASTEVREMPIKTDEILYSATMLDSSI